MRDFLKHTFATLLGICIFLGLSLGGLIVILMLLSVATRDPEPQVKDKSVLVFDLSQKITDAPPNSSPRDVINDALSGGGVANITLRSVVDALDQASHDRRIIGLYLKGGDGGNPTTGFATLKEVRGALERFKATGKKIYAYDVDWKERDYYLGTVADELVINPIGQMEMNGLSSEGIFFSGALQKFGIGMQVTRVGKYKSAVEPYLLDRNSAASQEQTQTLLNDLWAEFETAVGKSRKLEAKDLKSITENQGLLDAEAALKAKLVDKVAYADEVAASFKQLTGEDPDNKSFKQISLKTYARETARQQPQRNNQAQVAILYAEGDIVNGQGGPGQVGGDRLAKQLRDLRLDGDVKAVVLRVNSRGGSATASEIIQREVILTRQTKPVVVSMGNVAASGGYWISTYADRIYAEANTITGSIGVFGLQPNIQKLANENGITWDVVKTGKFADSQTIYRPKTAEELELVQRSVDQIYDQFLSKVSQSRKLDRAKVSDIAQGRVWSGVQAKALGLVDELGGLQNAVQEAARRAELGDRWHVEEYPKTRSWDERILEQLFGASVRSVLPASEPASEDFWTEELQKAQTEFKGLRAMNDPRGIYLQLPFMPQIH